MTTLRLTIKVKNKQNHILKHPVLACAGLHVNFRQDSFCPIFTLVALANGGRCYLSFSQRTIEQQSHISTFSMENKKPIFEQGWHERLLHRHMFHFCVMGREEGKKTGIRGMVGQKTRKTCS